MKKLLGIVVMGLLWCNVGFAEKLILNCKGEFLGIKMDDYYIVDTSEKTLKIKGGEAVNVRINDAEILMTDLNTNKSSKGYNLRLMKFDRYAGKLFSFNVYINDEEFNELQKKVKSLESSSAIKPWSYLEIAATKAFSNQSHKDNLFYNAECKKSDKKF
tara:strand:- start:45 stop:521 length:477 start_codon:yes stop_codon:yes gene_type:complete